MSILEVFRILNFTIRRIADIRVAAKPGYPPDNGYLKKNDGRTFYARAGLSKKKYIYICFLFVVFLNDGWPGGALKKIEKKKLKQNKKNSDLWISTGDRGPLGFTRGPLGFNRGPKTPHIELSNLFFREVINI